ncbi:MAG: DUF3892 domain-containing protein [Angelakisella sp.]
MPKNEHLSSLPMNALSEVPTPKADAKKIVALTKESGVISGYKLSDGEMVSKQEGVARAKQGDIAGVGIAKREGTEYLKSLPDQTEKNNLGSLPTVEE